MSWIEAHKLSEELAGEAHEALRSGDTDRARALFMNAAMAEQSALLQLTPADKPRTYGITAVSTVALWYKGGDLSNAESIAYRVLAECDVPAFSAEQLRTLLQTIWNARAQQSAGVTFVPGQVQVSVRGGEVVKGGAPLDLIVDKVQTIQALFYRTTEWLNHMPLRRSGPAPREIQESCRPWLFQGVPASYQFVVAIQSPRQTDMFPKVGADPRLVASTFLSILENAAGDPAEGLTKLVEDKEYKAAFLKLTRNLAPSGRLFSEMEVKAAGEARTVVLVPESRKVISQTLRDEAPLNDQLKTLEPVVVNGILRAVHLNEDWIEVMVDGKAVRITGVGETLDDVIGPMVNRPVTVHAVREKTRKLRFRDIEADE